MIVVPEQEIAELVTRADAFAAVEKVFASMARGDAVSFPVVREALGHADALRGFKPGFDRAALNLGLKSSGYWPGNADRGLTNHQSTVLLFDADTGRCRAVIGGTLLTALRTAIGECQHAVAAGALTDADITPIGAVIDGNHPGRTADDEVTLFVGTGVGLQDLAVASAAVALAVAKGVAVEVSL